MVEIQALRDNTGYTWYIVGNLLFNIRDQIVHNDSYSLSYQARRFFRAPSLGFILPDIS
jgi:hypothetical protein